MTNKSVFRTAATEGQKGTEYWLTPAGNALRPIVSGLGHWGLVHARDSLTLEDLYPTFLRWGFRKRAIRDPLPDERIVVRFEFSGVPAKRSKFRILWLPLERSDVDVGVKDPGYPVDVTLHGKIADFVSVYLGPVSLRLDLRVGGNFLPFFSFCRLEFSQLIRRSRFRFDAVGMMPTDNHQLRAPSPVRQSHAQRRRSRQRARPASQRASVTSAPSRR